MSIIVENQIKDYGWNPHTTDWVSGGNDTKTLVPLVTNAKDITAKNNTVKMGYALVRGQNHGNSNFLIEGNTLDNVAHLVITDGSNGVISKNIVTNARNGVQLDGPANNWEIKGNDISLSREDSPGLYSSSYPQGDGVILNEGTTDITLTDNRFHHNVDCGLDCKTKNFTIRNLIADYNKIGIKAWYNGSIYNSLLVRNKKDVNGGNGQGLFCQVNSNIYGENLTIVDNDEVDLWVYLGGKLTLKKCIIGPKLRDVLNKPNVQLIDCWMIGTQGDPGFVDQANGNYRLKADAPCNKAWGYQYADAVVPQPSGDFVTKADLDAFKVVLLQEWELRFVDRDKTFSDLQARVALLETKVDALEDAHALDEQVHTDLLAQISQVTVLTNEIKEKLKNLY